LPQSAQQIHILQLCRAGEPEEIFILLCSRPYKISYNCKKVYVIFDFLKPDTIFQITQ